MRIVLAPAGSAPGADGEPYEVDHLGARFVARLLGQALRAAAIGEAELGAALGPSVDLLVWILKREGAEGTSAVRLLQSPSCFRRLFGMAIVSVAQPRVEPLLCRYQAGVAGGHCGPNIRRAFAHLASDPAPPPPPAHKPPPNCWAVLLTMEVLTSTTRLPWPTYRPPPEAGTPPGRPLDVLFTRALSDTVMTVLWV